MQLDQSEVRRNRQKYTLELRKQTREEIFMKRRNLLVENNAMVEQQGSNQTQFITVLDERYKTIIQQAIKRQYKKEELITMIGALSSPNPIDKHSAIIGIRKIISAQDGYDAVQFIVDQRILPIVIELIKVKQYPHIRFQSCWILSNIAAGTSQNCEKIVQNKGLDALFQLLAESHYKLNEQAIWAIGNMAGDNIKLRDHILKQNGLQLIIKVAEKSTHKSVIKLSAWSIANLCRGSPLPKYELIKKGLATIGKIILSHILPDQQLSDCLWAVCSHTNDGQKTRIQSIVQIPNFVANVINICKTNPKLSVQIPSLRIIGNISIGNQLHTEQILRGGGLDLLYHLLNKEKKTTRRQACWIISNICGGTASQVKQVIFRNDIINKLAAMLWEDQIDIKAEICYIFKNMAFVGDRRIVLELVMRFNIAQGVINLLKENQSRQALTPGLKCLYELLCLGVQQNIENCILKQIQKIPGCLQRLELLQHHKSNQVYQAVIKIFQLFFSVEQAPTM